MDIKPGKKSDQPGLIRRQSRSQIGDFKHARALKRPQMSAAPPKTQQPFKLETGDIEENLDSKAKKPGFWGRLKPSYIRRNFSWRRFFKKTGLVFGSLVILGLGYLGYKLFFAVQNIIDRDSGGALALQGDIDPSQLRGEGDGRVNILLIGEGGEKHDNGSRLADTIIVLSIDPFNNEAALLSIPRDLRVPVPDQWNMKINAAYAIGMSNGFSESGYPKNGPGLMQKTVEQTLDIPIHYFLQVDFKGLEQAISTVGGVDVNVEETLYDYDIAWEYGINHIPAGRQTLNANEALFYARSRKTTSDFDRGERQRQILVALKEKILSLGTFSDPTKVVGLIDAAGNHAGTNLELGEMRRLYEIGNHIGSDKIVSADITEYITNGGGSDYIPKAGEGNFSEIQRYVRSIFIDGFIKKEAAVIDVLNGSGQAGAATAKAEELRSYGYALGVIGDADSGDYAATRLYDLTGDSPFTKRYLEQRLKTTAVSGRDLPKGVKSNADFVIIVGADATR